MSIARIFANELYNPRLFSRPLATFFDDSVFRHASAVSGWNNMLYIPRADVSETKKDYRIDAEVPGYSKEDISVEFTDGTTLQISGKTSHHSSTCDGLSAPTSVEDVPDESAATPTASKEVSQQGKQDNQASSQESTYHVTEIATGSFSRSFVLPPNIDPSAVQASLNNGILSVLVPKISNTETRRIAIQ